MARRMAEQMELFEPVERGFDEGGLMDEGGTVDPVSGNDVPPGSTQEEVRDDIPAQLSEGEFVFPADVVRYIGLENLMRMRQEAKQGLAQMEAMGQMGNSEEATVEDNLPFDMYDLDVEDDDQRNFNVGGYVAPTVPTNPYSQPGQVNPQTGTYTLPGTGIAGYQVPTGGQTGYTPYGGAAPYFQPVQFTGPQFQTATQTTNLPTFADTVGSNPGKYDELRTYVNDAGQILQIPFKDGQPIYPIPEGYRPEGDQPAAEQPTTAPDTTVKTAQVTEQGDSSNDETDPGGASIALGGTAVGPAIGGGIPGTKYEGPSRRVVGATLYDVSFKNVGMNPFAFSLNMMSKDGGLPPEGIGVIGVKGNSKAVIELPAVAYNELRNDPRGPQAKAVQEALAARDSLTSGNKASYVDGVLSVEDKNGDMVAVSKDAVDLIGSTMYSELKAEADGTFGFGKTDNLVDTAKDYYSGMSDVEKDNAQKALSAYNDYQFSDFVAEKDVSDYYSGKGTLGGKSYSDSASDNTSDNSSSSSSSSSGGGTGESGGDPGPGEAGVICLTEDMKVKRNGVIDFVTKVQVGDIIDNTVVTEVLHKHMREGYYKVNGELKITNDHPVLANGSWKRTEDLVLGDYINNVKVTSLEYVEQVTPTVYIGTAEDRYDVYTEGDVYTVHGQYKKALQKAA